MRVLWLLAGSLVVAVGCKSFEKVPDDPGGAGGSSGAGGGSAGNCNYELTFQDDFLRGDGAQVSIGNSQLPGDAWLEQQLSDWVTAGGDLVITKNEPLRATSPHNPTAYRARLRFSAKLSSEPGAEAAASFRATSASAESGVSARLSRVAGQTGIYEGGTPVETTSNPLPEGDYYFYVELEVSERAAVMTVSQNAYDGSKIIELTTGAISQSQEGDRFAVFLNDTSLSIGEVSLEAGVACP